MLDPFVGLFVLEGFENTFVPGFGEPLNMDGVFVGNVKVGCVLVLEEL